jgi:uncharacterized protein (TIRG00374 family)
MGTSLVGDSGTDFRVAILANQKNWKFMKSTSGTCKAVPGREPIASTGKLSRWGVRSWRLWIGIAFSLCFLILSLRNVDLVATATVLRRVDVLILVAAVANYVLSIAAKAIRWQLLLTLPKTPSFGRAFAFLSIGQMMNSFLPAHLGEFARAYLMGEAEAESKVYILGTIAVERLADLIFLLISISLLLSQMALPDWLVFPARDTAILIAILVPAIIILIWQKKVVFRTVEWASRFIPSAGREWLARQTHFGFASIESVSRPRLLARLFAWSTIVCVLSTVTNYLVFLALHLVVPVWASLLLLVVLQIGSAIPSSPGRIGVFQYLIIITLAILALDKNVALGYSVLLYLIIYVTNALLGVYCLWREKVTWHTLEEAAAVLKRLKSKTA